jgi:hypothetical protein
VGGAVELVIDPLRGEKISIELPLVLRTSPEQARGELGLSDWVDVSDPIVARGVALLRAARRASPPLSLALLGGAANRLRCRVSNEADSGLRRPLHDLDVACLHKELRPLRAFLASVHEQEGSGLRFFESSGDRIFNSLSEGRRLRLHMLLGQVGSEVSMGSVDLLADEFRFCHRFDLREDLSEAPHQFGTLSPTLLLLAKLQYIQRVPGEDRNRVTDRVLEPFGRRDVVIGPEGKDVRDVLALLLEHPLAETPGGISPGRLKGLLATDWGFWKTVSMNVGMVARSAPLRQLPEEPRAVVTAQLTALSSLLSGLAPKRRFAFLGGTWWEEVDAQPSVDGKATAA